MSGDFDGQVAGIAALHDPTRRALYDFVVHSGGAVSREQAATAVGIRKALAAFHLDKLEEEGLLDVEFRRLTGRSGPGAGRPAKLYRRSARQLDVSLPPREYDLAGLLLAAAIEASERTGSAVRDELERGSYERGRTIGEQARERAGRRPSQTRRQDALVEVLTDHGFEPHVVGSDIVLANCPFHSLARTHTDLVCGMNLRLLEGVRGALDVGEGVLEARLEPEPGQCCVKFCTVG